MQTAAARRGGLFLLAASFTLLNALKPLHVDDAAYFSYARQVAAKPLDPYGFAVFWYDHPQPANEILAPPLLPYWWSLALRVTDRPFLWKLWLLPFSLCLVASLHFLSRRFARRLALLLTWLTVLSPAMLPGFNLMLDVPALSLALSALALFVSGVDRGSLRRVLLAGLVAGLAMQTKYTALLVPAILFLYAFTQRRLRLWPPALAVALTVFAAWEVFVARCYGVSHFLYHLRHGHDSLFQRGYLVPLLFSLTGTVAPALLLLGLAAQRVRTRLVIAAGILTLLGFAVLLLVDLRFRGKLTPGKWLFGPAATAHWEFTFAEVLFGLCGLVLWTIAGVVAWRLCRLSRPGWQRLWRARPDDWFLVLWLGLEIAGFFALSPFPAVRRVAGLIVVLTLFFGRLASRTCRSRPRLLGSVLAYGILLGLLFQVVDVRAATAQREAVHRAVAWIAEQEDSRKGATIWFTGHWGWQFYAERAGLRPLVATYEGVNRSVPLPLPSLLRRGDWLVVPDEPVHQQRFSLREGCLREVHRFTIEGGMPLETLPFYYVGHVGLEHRRGPRMSVRIYRVLREFVPESGRELTRVPPRHRLAFRARRARAAWRSATMLTDYLWTLIILIPLSVPVMGILFLAACALSDRETGFIPAMIFGSITFLASFPLGWWLVSLLAQQETRPEVRFGTMHALGVGLAILASWLIGSIVYSVAFQGRILKGMQVAAIEVLMRLLLGALLGAVMGVVLAIAQVARDPAGRTGLLWGGLIFGVLLAVVVTLVVVTGIMRRRTR